jgi:DNA repair protein RecO
MEAKTLGILLQAIPYLGSGRILKVFTRDAGLMTLMAKKPSLKGFSPFCIAEWVYKKGQKEIHTLIDGGLMDSLLCLRESYAALTAAGSMAQDLLRSQMAAKHSPDLYNLLCSYFTKLGAFENPLILQQSFRLKLLIHEGLLSFQTGCAICGQEASSVAQGESVCPSHTAHLSIGFSPLEWKTLLRLAYSIQFSQLREIEPLPSLEEKLTSLLLERIHH